MINARSSAKFFSDGLEDFDNERRTGRPLLLQLRAPTKMFCTLSVLSERAGEPTLVIAWISGGKHEVARVTLPAAPEHLVRGLRERIKADPYEINFQSPARRALGIVSSTNPADNRAWAWWTKKDGVRLPGKVGVSLETGVRQCLDNIILLHQAARDT